MGDVRPTPRKRFWTPGEVAKRIGVSTRTIERYCDSGLLECQRTPGGHRRILDASVRQLLGQSVAA